MIKICPILSTAKHLSATMGTNNGTVQCQKGECAICKDTQFGWVCAISGEKVPQSSHRATRSV